MNKKHVYRVSLFNILAPILLIFNVYHLITHKSNHLGDIIIPITNVILIILSILMILWDWNWQRNHDDRLLLLFYEVIALILGPILLFLLGCLIIILFWTTIA